MEVMDDPGCVVGVRRDEPGGDPAGGIVQRRRREDGPRSRLSDSSTELMA
jgi:hypothetical protein